MRSHIRGPFRRQRQMDEIHENHEIEHCPPPWNSEVTMLHLAGGSKSGHLMARVLFVNPGEYDTLSQVAPGIVE